jgi:hypothetical protein
MLEIFFVELRDKTDLDRLGEDLVVVSGIMQPAYVGLWLRRDKASRGGGGGSSREACR